MKGWLSGGYMGAVLTSILQSDHRGSEHREGGVGWGGGGGGGVRRLHEGSNLHIQISF